MRASILFFASAAMVSAISSTPRHETDITPNTPPPTINIADTTPTPSKRQTSGSATQFKSLEDALSAIFGSLGLNGTVLQGSFNRNGTLTGSLTNGTQGRGGFLSRNGTTRASRNDTAPANRNSTTSSRRPRDLTVEDLSAMAQDNGLVPILKEKRQQADLSPEMLDLINAILTGTGKSRNGTQIIPARNGTFFGGFAARNGTGRAGRNGTTRAGLNGTARAGRNGTTRASRNGTARAGRNNTSQSGSDLRGRVAVADLEAIADADADAEGVAKRQPEAAVNDPVDLINQILNGDVSGIIARGGAASAGAVVRLARKSLSGTPSA